MKRHVLIALAALLTATAFAPAAGEQGQASVECKVTTSGKLTGCVVLSESPAGAGVGAFALRLVSAYRVPPNDRRVRNGKVVIPLKFKMPG